LDGNGVPHDKLSFDDDALMKIMRDYTQEAGLRNFEREIATICRKVATRIAKGDEQPVHLTVNAVNEYLGPIRFFSEVAERIRTPGVAIGLAWTQTGGDIIFIEATKMKGKKTLTLTGQLGDVMKESAQAALSYIRSRARDFGIDENFFENYDIHIHVPAGAIPKDGPSAGVTIAVALASLLTEQHVRPYLAMTGEITLRGNVLPVGGIKEKVLAAKRAGIKTVLLPRKNEKDMVEVPKELLHELTVSYIDTIEDAIAHAIEKVPEMSYS
jgi:ATP-dependent Lon protease